MENDHTPPADTDVARAPSLFSVIAAPAIYALLGTLCVLVGFDICLTALGSMRSQMRGDAIIGYHVETISRLSRIEAAVAPPPR